MKCPACNRPELTAADFHPRTTRPGRYQSLCKRCANARRRELYALRHPPRAGKTGYQDRKRDKFARVLREAGYAHTETD